MENGADLFLLTLEGSAKPNGFKLQKEMLIKH